MDTTLPNTLSGLLKVAIPALRACEREREHYTINMSEWHSFGNDGQCHVCLAGAALAKVLDWSPDQTYPGRQISNDLRFKLAAINELREGRVADAYCRLNPGTEMWDLSTEKPIFWSRNITHYAASRECFYAQMEELQKDFEEAGL